MPRARETAFAPDDKLLATGAWDGSLRFWDTRTWKQAQQTIVACGSESGLNAKLHATPRFFFL